MIDTYTPMRVDFVGYTRKCSEYGCEETATHVNVNFDPAAMVYRHYFAARVTLEAAGLASCDAHVAKGESS